MTPVRHAVDGRIHYSELSQHRRSPAHARLAFEQTRVPTRAMVLGSVADDLVFHGGKNVALYTGKVRNGKEWQTFRAENEGKILCIDSEFEQAHAVAFAVRNDPVARDLMSGAEFQRRCQWERDGLPCATGIEGSARGGFDVLNIRHRHRRPFIADMKTTASSEPEELERHSWRMLWHCQGAFYVDGAIGAGIDVQDFWLIAVEATPPHPVTCMRLTDGLIAHGRKTVRRWVERHRACEESGTWPGYVQSEVEMMVPSWVEE
jgi:PDDEXK-like domain of unknown function (DUF3799)